MTNRIEVFADIMCPFTHFSLRRLVVERGERHAHAALRVRAWPLEWINGQPIARELAAREVDALRASVAPDLFTAFDTAPFPRSSIGAFGLVAAAYERSDAVGERMSLAVRDAVFEQGLDVADEQVLQTLGNEFGVTPPDSHAAQTLVRADWERGVARGVQGSPHYFVDGHNFFCPSLAISHRGENFDVRLQPERMQQFYASALAG